MGAEYLKYFSCTKLFWNKLNLFLKEIFTFLNISLQDFKKISLIFEQFMYCAFTSGITSNFILHDTRILSHLSKNNENETKPKGEDISRSSCFMWLRQKGLHSSTDRARLMFARDLD